MLVMSFLDRDGTVLVSSAVKAPKEEKGDFIGGLALFSIEDPCRMGDGTACSTGTKGN